MKRHNSQWTILWIFQIHPAKDRTFRRMYGPGGDWARLFAKDPKYIGTELLRSATDAHCYLTVDRWASRDAYHNFKTRYQNEYVALDARCEALTISENKIGEFSSVGRASILTSERRGAKSSKRRLLKLPS